MSFSKSADRLREMIVRAIESQKVSRMDLDMILHIAEADGYIDPHEQELLDLLQEMIDKKEVRII